MKKKIVWLLVSSVMILSLLAASCAPATNTTPTVPTQTTTPTTSAPTTTAPTTPTTGTTPSSGPEMVKVSLKKLDGTTVEKMVEKPKYGGELSIMRSTAIFGWDEASTVVYTGGRWLDLIYEELLEGDWTRGPGGTEEVSWLLSGWYDITYFKGGLAESWELKPPDTIIFHIRKGVRWALNPAVEASRLVGGRELTADDIVWNIKRLYFEIKTSSAYGNAGISRPTDVYAEDDNTVVVKAAPGQLFMTFENMADWFSVMAPDPVKKWGDAQDWSRAVGTDAYQLDDYVPMSAATYIKNPNYWQKDPMFPENQLPYIDTVKLLIVPDASTRMSALRTGKADQSGEGVAWEDAESLQKTSPEVKWVRYLSGATIPAGRQDKPELPFKDINVRRALMMALNLNEITSTYYGGNAEVFSYPVTNTKEWSRAFTPLDQIGLAKDGFDTKKIYQYNPDEARKLLADAGYPNGFKTSVVLTTTSVDLASIVKEYWSKVGVELSLDVKESGVLSAMLQKKSFTEMYWGGYANVGLPHNMDPNRSGHHFNWAMVTDPAVLERYDKMAAAVPRSDEWWNIVKDNNVYLVHSVNYFPLPQAYNFQFWQPWVKRYHGELSIGTWNPHPWVKFAWIDQDLKKSMVR